jgi:ABC-type antimicrobial peptide transport system ATPase subunit
MPVALLTQVAEYWLVMLKPMMQTLCIVGANGSGKSNFFDGMCSAFSTSLALYRSLHHDSYR